MWTMLHDDPGKSFYVAHHNRPPVIMGFLQGLQGCENGRLRGGVVVVRVVGSGGGRVECPLSKVAACLVEGQVFA